MPRFIRKKRVNNIPKKTNSNSNSKNGNGIKTNNGMTRNQKIFADEWLIDRNGTRAYKVAYPRTRNDNVAGVQAHTFLKIPKIAEYINKKLDKMSAKAEINQEWVLERMKRLSEYRVDDFFDDEGDMKPLSEIPRDKLYAVCGFKVIKKILTQKDSANIEKTIMKEFKLPDKRAVLDSIGRHLGMFEKDNLQKAPRTITVKLVD